MPSYNKHMDKKVKIFFGVAIVLAIALVVGLRWQDSDGRLAPGTTIAGIDVGGELAKGAEIKVEKRAEWKGLVVKVDDKPSILRGLQAKPQVNKAVALALRESENRSFFSKVLGSSGGDYSLQWRYSQAELEDKLRWLKSAYDQPPVNASPIYIGNGRIAVRRGKTGMTLPWNQSLTLLERKALLGGGEISLQKREEAPKALTRGEAKEIYPNLLVVDRATRKLYHYRNLRLQKAYNVAIGMPGFETPTGRFQIQDKAVDPVWVPPPWAGSIAGQAIPGGTAANPLIDRWMGVANGVGFHGTRDLYSLGSAASHGCIRMDPADIIPLYEKISVGTPVIITR